MCVCVCFFLGLGSVSWKEWFSLDSSFSFLGRASGKRVHGFLRWSFGVGFLVSGFELSERHIALRITAVIFCG